MADTIAKLNNELILARASATVPAVHYGLLGAIVRRLAGQPMDLLASLVHMASTECLDNQLF